MSDEFKDFSIFSARPQRAGSPPWVARPTLQDDVLLQRSADFFEADYPSVHGLQQQHSSMMTTSPTIMPRYHGDLWCTGPPMLADAPRSPSPTPSPYSRGGLRYSRDPLIQGPAQEFYPTHERMRKLYFGEEVYQGAHQETRSSSELTSKPHSHYSGRRDMESLYGYRTFRSIEVDCLRRSAANYAVDGDIAPREYEEFRAADGGDWPFKYNEVDVHPDFVDFGVDLEKIQKRKPKDPLPPRRQMSVRELCFMFSSNPPNFADLNVALAGWYRSKCETLPTGPSQCVPQLGLGVRDDDQHTEPSYEDYESFYEGYEGDDENMLTDNEYQPGLSAALARVLVNT